MSESYTVDKLARIQYQCRRGMLELDVFLMPFCADCFVDLSATQQENFIDFLKEADPDLFTWLMGYGEAKAEFLDIVKTVRDYQLSKKSL